MIAKKMRKKLLEACGKRGSKSRLWGAGVEGNKWDRRLISTWNREDYYLMWDFDWYEIEAAAEGGILSYSVL